MEYLKIFRAAGEATASAPLYLCQETQDQLMNWQRLPVEQMQAEIVNDIQANDRFEFLAIDDAGKLRAMMVLYVDYDPHYGSVIYTRYAFSAEPQALTQGYRWMKQLAKSLNLNGFIITRQIAANKIVSKFNELHKQM
ncbi:GNAT family protein [Serratia marcescens]|uniref:Uncharacterized protein n=1 Tax=Serratia marcescens TaxID=615 RepID=A0AAP8TP56_SERMA|nr:hypothetical protein [Serratia marcescens]PNO65043.1 hypothetical protein MC70_017720 [Serratia marcescens]